MEATTAAILSGVTAMLGFICVIVLSQINATIGRTERKLDLILKHSGIDLHKLAVEQASTLMRQGRKIDAIKLYRDFTGCSLSEAKAKVEAMR